LFVAQACSTPRGPYFFRYSGFLTWVIELFRLFFRVEVVEIAEPFIEAVHCRQELVAIAQMVLAELTGGTQPATYREAHRRPYRASRGDAIPIKSN